MEKINVVVLASGNGSNLQALIDIQKLNLLPINISGVIANRQCLALNRAEIAGLENSLYQHNSSYDSVMNDNNLISLVEKYNPGLIICAGYMRILGKTFLDRFNNISIVNIHPSLPLNQGGIAGANSIEEAFSQFMDGKINETGVMVHHVTEELDAGEVIDFITIPILNDDTLESLKSRVQMCEKPLLICSLMKLLISSNKNQSNEVKEIKNNIISGKVRDRFDIGYDLICFYLSDRLSSFDRAICDVSGKGRLLNLINRWWMRRTGHIIPNHLLYIDQNYMICKKCSVIPLEIVVRGYITGSTSTSLWTHYNKGVRNYCGIEFPDGLNKNDRLSKPVITPTTKGEIDEPISREEILNRGIVTEEEIDFIFSKALELFRYGTEVVDKKGLILVDTKYEFGRTIDGEIILIDEIHTCDSSRFWLKESYKPGVEPKKLDKDAARDYIKSVCDPYNDPIPEIPQVEKDKVFSCYKRLYELLIDGNYIEIIKETIDLRKVSNLELQNNEVVKNYYQNHHENVAVILSGSPSDEWFIHKLRTELRNKNIVSLEHVCSAHKKTKQLLTILDGYNNSLRNVIYITVAGRSNALSGVVACNVNGVVIACPPLSDKDDLMVNINSTLQMPSNVPVMTILEPKNVAIACQRIFHSK
jgi:phosphoribosylaminoimidazole-succinocarboxamide synthase